MKRLIGAALAATILIPALPASQGAAQQSEHQELVDTASRVIGRFERDSTMGWFRSNVRKAEGVLIVPTLIKGGFIFGASGGSGVLMSRDRSNGLWSSPAFYTMGSLTFGFQVGAEVSEIILLIMSKRGMDSFLGTTAKLGGDISVAAGPIGIGAKAALADVIAFSRTRGLYGGLNVEGAVITTRDSWNHEYYNRIMTPSDILVRRTVRNPKAEKLRQAITRVARRKAEMIPATPRQDRFGSKRHPSPRSDVTPPPPRRDGVITSEPLPWQKR